ncbi:hypothetical protein [Fictibacillus norfolkensis]|uniref:Uncharacterized protein n=1 Tax=Fictibacillus norfolkensis TaxID=2762233 RepID=A0ABR8SQ63_9BACL|nr:hypothetical protein [Fictibacillus norfolkensis]MBD7965535.1 hypothetical protein [Fictibacillus norfolkensis]
MTVDVEQGDVDVNQGQGQTLGSQTQNPIENQTQSMGSQTGNQAQTNTQGQTGSSLGPQSQTNTQGLSGSTLGPQTQNTTQGQSGSTMGDQTQNPSQGQSGSTLTQTQNPSQTGSTVTQNSTPTLGGNNSQTQTHTNGNQTTGAQTLQANPTNNSSADVSVNGVTVSVPVNVNVHCGCKEKKKKEKRRPQKGNRCDCCAKALGNLLNQVRQNQLSSLETVNLYLTDSPALDNPLENQTITNVNGCSTVSVATGSIPIVTPITTLQLCKVAGLQATTPSLVQTILAFANNCTNNPCFRRECDCGGDDDCNTCNNEFCSCNCCANGIGEQLPIGGQVNLIVEDLEDPIGPVFVRNVCDCLGFFVDDLITPTIVYVFTLCAINGFTPVLTPIVPPPAPPAPPAPPQTPIITLFNCCMDDED